MHTLSDNTSDHQVMELFVEGLNQRLHQAGADGAERAFGVGCGLGLLPVATAILLLLLFKVINLILAVILTLLGMLALLSMAALLANLARVNVTRRAYRSGVQAEIRAYLSVHGMTRQEFDALVANLLPEDAPLRACMALFPFSETLEE